MIEKTRKGNKRREDERKGEKKREREEQLYADIPAQWDMARHPARLYFALTGRVRVSQTTYPPAVKLTQS